MKFDNSFSIGFLIGYFLVGLMRGFAGWIDFLLFGIIGILGSILFGAIGGRE